MPGMWDCHVHFMGSDKTSIDEWAIVPPALAGARSAKDVAATLNAGFTSVREMAGYGVELSKAIDEGWLLGPNTYSSISILGQTSGHGDAHSMCLDLSMESDMGYHFSYAMGWMSVSKQYAFRFVEVQLSSKLLQVAAL